MREVRPPFRKDRKRFGFGEEKVPEMRGKGRARIECAGDSIQRHGLVRYGLRGQEFGLAVEGVQGIERACGSFELRRQKGQGERFQRAGQKNKSKAIATGSRI